MEKKNFQYKMEIRFCYTHYLHIRFFNKFLNIFLTLLKHSLLNKLLKHLLTKKMYIYFTAALECFVKKIISLTKYNYINKNFVEFKWIYLVKPTK